MKKRRCFGNLCNLIPAIAAAALILTMAGCAWLQRKTGEPSRPAKKPAKPVEQAGVRAWGVTAYDVPVSGPLAKARMGDFALTDGDILIVIGDSDRGGSWIDAARTADEGYDYLDEIRPQILQPAGGGPLEYSVDSVAIAAEAPDKPPAIVTRGHFEAPAGLEIETRYEIIPSSDTVVMTTHVRNTTTSTIEGLELVDRVAWGADYVFIPRIGNTRRPNMKSATVPWLASWQDDFSLGILGEDESFEVRFGKDAATIAYRQTGIGPNSEVAYRRLFPVRDHDFSAIADLSYRLRGVALGRLQGRVEELETGNNVGDCRVEIVTSPRTPGETGSTPLTWVYTKSDGTLSVDLPAGRYFPLTHRAVGRAAPLEGRSYDVEAGKTTSMNQALQVSPKIMVPYEVRDADTNELLPCKIRFRAYPDFAAIDFGPAWQSPGARDAFFSATGQGEINLTPGDYAVVISHGPEYNTAQIERLRVRGRGTQPIVAKLERQIREDERISVDIGVRTSASPGCQVSPYDRILSAMAEGVQCLVTGDVGFVTDLNPTIEKAGLAGRISAISGRRIIWQGPEAAGELVVFPCKPGPVDPAWLKAEAEAKTAGDLIKSVREHHPDSLIVAARPMEWENDEGSGFIYSQGYKLSTREPFVPQGRGAYVPEGLDFDLYEVIPGRMRLVEVDRLSRRMYTRLLREVKRYGLSAGSDSQWLWGNECGYPRTYVALDKDAGPTLFEQMRENLVQGRALLSNGPQIRLLVNGKPPGSFITDTDGTLNILLEVQAASWVNVRATIVFDGEFFSKHIMVPPTQEVSRYPRSALGSPEFTIPIKHDVIVSATAAGDRSLAPVTVIDERLGFEAYPYAITGPIFVDADGDGKCTPPSPFEKLPVTEDF